MGNLESDTGDGGGTDGAECGAGASEFGVRCVWLDFVEEEWQQYRATTGADDSIGTHRSWLNDNAARFRDKYDYFKRVAESIFEQR